MVIIIIIKVISFEKAACGVRREKATYRELGCGPVFTWDRPVRAVDPAVQAQATDTGEGRGEERAGPG